MGRKLRVKGRILDPSCFLGGYTSDYLWYGAFRMVMKRALVGVFAALMASAALAVAQDKKDSDKKKDEKVVVKGTPAAAEAELPGDSTTDNSVTVGGQAIAYRAVAGTLTVGST